MSFLRKTPGLFTGIGNGGLEREIVASLKVILWLAVIYFLCAGLYKTYRWMNPPPPPVRNYHPIICDDAPTTEVHNEKRNDLNQFVVTMKEGCWSGFVHLPSSWAKQWWDSPHGKQDNWWFAIWFPEPAAPLGPFGLNGNPPLNGPPVFRLQGHGDILFYRNVPNGASGASGGGTAKDAPPDSAHAPTAESEVAPIPKPVGPAVEKMNGSIRFGFYHCLRVADTVLCRGYARSEYNVKRGFSLHTRHTFLTDDNGKRYPASQLSLADRTCRDCDDQIYPSTVIAFSATFPNVPPELTHATLILDHTAFEGDSETQVDVLIDRK